MSREISNRVNRREARSQRSGGATRIAERLNVASGAALAVFGISAFYPALANANTAATVVVGQTNLASPAAYSTNPSLPGTGNDVTFSAVTYTPAGFSLNGTNLSIGTLNDLSPTAITILNSGANDTITLNGGTNNTSGADAADLLFVAGGSTLTIGGNGFALGVALASAGNFDIAGTATINTSISDGGLGFSKTGVGTLTLTGQNSYTGTTNVMSGTLVIAGGSAIPAVKNAVSINTGAVYELDESAVTNGSHSSGSVSGAAFGGTTAITVSGNGKFEVMGKTGTGLINAGGTGSVVSLGNGGQTINMNLGTFGMAGSGLIDIEGGTLVNGGGGHAVWTSNYASMTIATGACFDIWDGQPVQVDALNGAGFIVNGSNNGTARILTVGDNGGSGTFTGVIGGGGNGGNNQGGNNAIGLTKIGAGTETLTGTNTYTGPTSVSGGSLIIGSTGSISNSATTVASGGLLGGTGTTGNISLTGTGTLSPGDSGAGILHTGNLALGTTGNLAIDVGGNVAGTSYDQVAVTGTVNLGTSSNLVLSTSGSLTAGDIYYIINNDGTGDAVTNHFATVNGTALSGSTFTLGALSFSISYTAEAGVGFSGVGNDVALRADVVPEPASLSLIGLGATTLLARRRRCRGR